MKILAIDFSSAQRSVAFLEGVAGAAALRLCEGLESGTAQTAAFEMIERVLRQAGVEREAVERLAVGIGPGSYNGIRASIALAQGWQMALGTKLVAVSSVEAIVAEAAAAGILGAVAVLLDAQRGEFYCARYEITSDGFRNLEALRLASPVEAQRAAADAQVIGPEVTRWFPKGRLLFPRAVTLARLAMARSDFVAGERMEPIYLRETKFVKAPPPRVLPP